jgi:hypothetical protein
MKYARFTNEKQFIDIRDWTEIQVVAKSKATGQFILPINEEIEQPYSQYCFICADDTTVRVEKKTNYAKFDKEYKAFYGLEFCSETEAQNNEKYILIEIKEEISEDNIDGVIYSLTDKYTFTYVDDETVKVETNPSYNPVNIFKKKKEEEIKEYYKTDLRKRKFVVNGNEIQVNFLWEDMKVFLEHTSSIDYKLKNGVLQRGDYVYELNVKSGTDVPVNFDEFSQLQIFMSEMRALFFKTKNIIVNELNELQEIEEVKNFDFKERFETEEIKQKLEEFQTSLTNLSVCNT